VARHGELAHADRGAPTAGQLRDRLPHPLVLRALRGHSIAGLFRERWDLGVEWSPCGQILVGVTWFENRIEDLIDFTPANVGEVTTRGVELEAAGTAWDDRIEWRLVHTWLDTEDEDTGLELVRRPEHSTSFDLRGRPCAELLLGVGGSWVSGTLDNDFSTFPAVRRELDDYVLLRIYGRYAFNETIAVHGRIENLLDDDYEEIANFPGRGLGFYAGFTVSW
jgi:vitamin B12 transporter